MVKKNTNDSNYKKIIPVDLFVYFFKGIPKDERIRRVCAITNTKTFYFSTAYESMINIRSWVLTIHSLIFSCIVPNNGLDFTGFDFAKCGQSLHALKLCFDNFLFDHFHKACNTSESDWEYETLEELYQKVCDVFDHFNHFIGNCKDMNDLMSVDANDVEMLFNRIISQLDNVAAMQYGHLDLISIHGRRPVNWLKYRKTNE